MSQRLNDLVCLSFFISHIYTGPKLPGGFRGVIHPSNFEKISLVGQNIASRREKTKQKMCAEI